MDARLVIQGICVCAAVFGGLFFLPVDQLLKPSPPAVTLEPLSTRVEGTFHQVPPDTRPQAIRDAERIEDEISQSELYAKMNGRPVKSRDELRAAVDDAPKSPTYVGYGTLPSMSEETPLTHDIDTAGMKVACFSTRDRDFGTDADDHGPPPTRHQIILYDATRYIPASSDLYIWVYSGCADAVRSSSAINQTQYKMTLRALLPAGPQYDPLRQEIMQSLNSTSKRTEG